MVLPHFSKGGSQERICKCLMNFSQLRHVLDENQVERKSSTCHHLYNPYAAGKRKKLLLITQVKALLWESTNLEIWHFLVKRQQEQDGWEQSEVRLPAPQPHTLHFLSLLLPPFQMHLTFMMPNPLGKNSPPLYPVCTQIVI